MNKSLTQRWKNQDFFPQNQDTFFNFKKGLGRTPTLSSTPSCVPLISKLKYNANTKVTEWSSHHISNKLLYHYFLNYFYFLMHHIFLYEWKVFKILKTSLEACFFWHELIFFQKVYSANSITEELLLKGAKKLYFTYYSCVVIILLNTGLYKSAFSTNSFRKLIFCLSALFVCVFCLLCVDFDLIFINFVTFA